MAVCIALLTAARAQPIENADSRLREGETARQRSFMAVDSSGLPPGCTIADGDIMVPLEPEGTVAMNWDGDVWPGGNVHFWFDSNVTAPQQALAVDAMFEWTQVANIRFIQHDSAPFGEIGFLRVRDSSGDDEPRNSSFVGLQGPLGQDLNFTSWNDTPPMGKFRFVHELGHALGLYHEQQRDDRDNYITINPGNVTGDNFDADFGFITAAELYGPYDFDSIMHYGRCAFSNNLTACAAGCPSAVGETIRVKSPYDAIWQCQSSSSDNQFIGQRNHVSEWDQRAMSFLYPWPDWRFQRSSTGDDDGPGNFVIPYQTFREGYEDTPPGGTLFVLEPSSHFVDYVLDKPMTITAPLGGVTLYR